jgi:3-polyprenyl-4-hydroxybenzoate decarboxylase and related decarboxylases
MRGRNQCVTRRARKRCMKSSVAAVFRCLICPSSNAGRKTAGVSSPCQMYIRAIRKPAHAMWAFTECKCTTSARPGCIGNFTRSARATANAITNAASGCRWLSRWGRSGLHFAATAPLPDGLDELLFAGFLRRKSIELVRCKTIDLEVPADVDFVLEGYVQPATCARKGHLAITPDFTPQSKTTPFSI